MEFTWTIQNEINENRSKIDSIYYIDHTIPCYFCEDCKTFGRSHSPKEGKHNIIQYNISVFLYRQIKEGLVPSSVHGSGWYITKEELESRIFEVLL